MAAPSIRATVKPVVELRDRLAREGLTGFHPSHTCTYAHVGIEGLRLTGMTERSLLTRPLMNIVINERRSHSAGTDQRAKIIHLTAPGTQAVGPAEPSSRTSSGNGKSDSARKTCGYSGATLSCWSARRSLAVSELAGNARPVSIRRPNLLAHRAARGRPLLLRFIHRYSNRSRWALIVPVLSPNQCIRPIERACSTFMQRSITTCRPPRRAISAPSGLTTSN